MKDILIKKEEKKRKKYREKDCLRIRELLLSHTWLQSIKTPPQR